MTARIDPARPPAPDPALARTGEPCRRAPRARRAVAITPAMLEGAPDFAPVPRGSSRYDGWTPDRQRVFVKLLAETGCVRRAAYAVGMSEVGAYLLRKAEGGAGFAQAWEEAQSIGVAKLADVAWERALYGVPVPVFHKGEQVGERRWFDNRLLSWVLRHHDPERYGGPTGHRVPPHVRAALRAEWERERAEEMDRNTESAREWLADTLALMKSRMIEPPGPGASQASQLAWMMTPDDFAVMRETPEPEDEPPAPPPTRPTRADSEAQWAARDAERHLTERADIWAGSDPRDAEANAADHWHAMVEAGRIDGGDSEDAS